MRITHTSLDRPATIIVDGKRIVIRALLALSVATLAACSQSTLAPTGDTPKPAHTLATVLPGYWQGQTLSNSHTGAIQATFLDSLTNGPIHGTFTWSDSPIQYRATVDGSLDQLVLSLVSPFTATPGHDECTYFAQGSVDATGTLLTGAYHASGDCYANEQSAGTFTLTKQGAQ